MTTTSQQTNAGPTYHGTASRLKPSIVHCKGMIDGTGSSAAFGNGIKTIVTYLVDELPKHVGTAVCGLHIGKDRDFDHDHDVNVGDALTADEIKNNLGLLTFSGGGDELETQLDSVWEVARNTAWTLELGTRKVIYVCSSSDSKPTQGGWNAQRVGEEVANLGIKILVIAPVGLALHDMATFSGGMSIPLSDNPSVTELQAVCKHLTKTMTQIGSSAGGGTQALHSKFGTNGTVAIGG